MKKIIGLLIASLALSSCASFEQWHKEWLVKHCTVEAGYNSGLTDGLTAGKMPDQDYANQCSANNNAINHAYLSGFSEGMKSRPQEININKTIKIDEKKAS